MNDSDLELISAWLDGEVSPTERAQVEALLAERPEARQLVEELRAMRTELAGLPRLSASAGFATRVLGEIAQRPATNSDTVAGSNGQTSLSKSPIGGDAESATPAPGGSAPTTVERPNSAWSAGAGISWAVALGGLGATAAALVAILTSPPLLQKAGPSAVAIAPETPGGDRAAAAPQPAAAPQTAGAPHDSVETHVAPIGHPPSGPRASGDGAEEAGSAANQFALREAASAPEPSFGAAAAPAREKRTTDELANRKLKSSDDEGLRPQTLAARAAPPAAPAPAAVAAAPDSFGAPGASAAPEGVAKSSNQLHSRGVAASLPAADKLAGGRGAGGAADAAPLDGAAALPRAAFAAPGAAMRKMEPARSLLRGDTAPDRTVELAPRALEPARLAATFARHGIDWQASEAGADAIVAADLQPMPEAPALSRDEIERRAFAGVTYILVEAPERSIEGLLAELSREGLVEHSRVAPPEQRMATFDAARPMAAPAAALAAEGQPEGRGELRRDAAPASPQPAVPPAAGIPLPARAAEPLAPLPDLALDGAFAAPGENAPGADFAANRDRMQFARERGRGTARQLNLGPRAEAASQPEAERGFAVQGGAAADQPGDLPRHFAGAEHRNATASGGEPRLRVLLIVRGESHLARERASSGGQALDAGALPAAPAEPAPAGASPE